MWYLDFSKAFDSVNHTLLIHKLQFFGINGNLLSWFNSYLNNRIQRIVLDGHTPEWLPVLSGVPQGSILGSLLFILFISDMPLSCISSKTGLFADDAKVYKTIEHILDCTLLQADLNRLYEWSVTLKMNFNHLKCKILTVSRRKATVYFNYMLNDNSLEHAISFKDLGVLVSSDLSWKEPIHNVVSKCNRVNCMIKRVVGYVNHPHFFSFKNKLMHHYVTKLQQSFDINNVCTWTSTCRCQLCVSNRM